MSGRWSSLLQALRIPEAMAAFDGDTWDLVVRQASSAGLLGRLGALARRVGIEPDYLDWGDAPTAPVAAAIPEAVAAVMALVGRWRAQDASR